MHELFYKYTMYKMMVDFKPKRANIPNDFVFVHVSTQNV